MAKILFLGDPHIKKNNIPEIRLLKEKLISLIVGKKPDSLVILGDMANDHSTMSLSAWKEISDFIFDCSALLPVYYIVGNHDMQNNSVFLEDDHFFNIFKKINTKHTVKIIDKTEKIEIGGLTFLGVPYVAPGRFKEALSGHSFDGISAIFCHQEFMGSKMGAIVSRSPDMWEEGMPRIVSGHIHDRQILFGGMVLYPGVGYQTGFGENSEKTVSMIDFSNGNEDVIDLGMPKKKIISLNVEKLLSFSPDENTSYRINLVDDIENILKFKKTKDFTKLKELFKIVPKPIDKVYVKNNQGTSGVTYFDALKKSIEEDGELFTLYSEILEEYSRGNG